ncbi:protein-L-isoaspartate O-methyltransferase [Inquilinus sp. CAU 1745]|uniref:protein-L-isoaspartate O-methyltransferase family protein n=1 Tax=Inquilinus sp. CAU 1745 TaxID=3140369 RepID=UPI00325BD938
MTDYTAARLNMVEGQVKPNRVTDGALLNAMANVPRELFVPAASRGIAYVDEDISIGGGRYLLEPMVFARLVQEARVGKEDVVLDIGCGTGYSTAVLARLANTVVALESDADFADRAGDLLSDLHVDNAVIVQGGLPAGHAAQGPYPVILINGAVAEVPQALFDQLADGGRLVTVLAGKGRVGRAVLYRRIGEIVSRRELFDASTPILPGFEPVPAFEF